MHYKLSPEPAYTREERSEVTIILGNLSTSANVLISAALDGLGYKTQVLPQADIDAFQTGKEFCNNGQCNPVYFTVGNLVNFLQNLRDREGLSNEEIVSRYVFITASSCGPCRFGMYESEYRLALEGAGFEGFRVLLFQQTEGLNQISRHTGLSLNLDFFFSVLNAVIISDHLNELLYRTRPFEVKPGETEQVYQQSLQKVSEFLRGQYNESSIFAEEEDSDLSTFEWLKTLWYYLHGYGLQPVLAACSRSFAAIETDPSRVKPVVKITGEFWAQTTEGDGNFQVFRFLESEGAQILIEPVTGWLLYLIWLEAQMTAQKLGARPGWKKKLLNLKFRLRMQLAAFLLSYQYKNIGRMLGNTTRPLLAMNKLARYSQNFMDVKYDGGEGHLEVAKNIYYTSHRHAHMVLSVKPFGCMPSTMSDAVQAKVVESFANMIFLPLETSGEGKINAYSRVQMSLAEARRQAMQEYEQHLQATGFTPEKIRQLRNKMKKKSNALSVFKKVPGAALLAVHYMHALKNSRPWSRL